METSPNSILVNTSPPNLGKEQNRSQTYAILSFKPNPIPGSDQPRSVGIFQSNVLYHGLISASGPATLFLHHNGSGSILILPVSGFTDLSFFLAEAAAALFLMAMILLLSCIAVEKLLRMILPISAPFEFHLGTYGGHETACCEP